MKTLALFNNKGVGKTTLTFHLGRMLARQGTRTLMVDCDPQCNLTAAVVGEDDLEDLWERSEAPGRTVASCVELVRRGRGDIQEPEPREVDDRLFILPGELSLSLFEQTLAEEWAKIRSSQSWERAIDVTSALDRLVRLAGRQVNAEVALFDVGPSLGALNRAVLVACDRIAVPLAPDIFSLQGLRNLGPTTRGWREDWHGALEARRQQLQPEIASREMRPIGYIVQQHLARADRPVEGYQKWVRRIPGDYRKFVLELPDDDVPDVVKDPQCIGFIKHFSSLVPLAQVARKPVFDLKQADGIGGGQVQAVARARQTFEALATEIKRRLP
ncbi:MAG: ParA family protein [bacterium]